LNLSPNPNSIKHSPNRLLAAISPEVSAAIQPHLSLLEFRQGEVLAERGAPVKTVYFPHSGIISLVVELNNGDMIETAMVGRDGVFNASSALDGKVYLNKALVQLAGFSSAIPVERLTEIADQFRDFRALLIRHEQVLFAQAQQSGACNASHLVEARLCRWLLRTRDLAGSDDLTVTQEFLAQMLGVRRSSLSIVANTLQKAGLIRYKRGHVHIVDVAALKECACECYETVRAHYERLPVANT
jgi:CRP-like cAMP-binding protein